MRPVNSTPSMSQNPFSGSVQSSDLPAATLTLSLQDAIQRGLRTNLGLVVGDQNTRQARAQELRARSQMRPNITGHVADTEQQINLAAYGFNFHFPGINIPAIVGPFNVFDARAFFSQSLLNFQLRDNSRAAQQLARAAEFTQKDARDMVVLLVTAGYLQVIADESRVEEARVEVDTASTLFTRAQDQLKSGLTPAIDSLRAQVELQTEQTRLRAFENDLAKDRLALARLIGLPLAQNYVLSDKVPYAELIPPDLTGAVDQALKTRSDYRSAEGRVQAAEASKRAAIAERYPSIALNADYGDQGPSPWNSHGTFTAGVGVNFPLWVGGRIKSDIEESDAELAERKAELSDLRGRIEYDVRAALLDLQTAADQLQVSRSSVDLARQTLTQARDRFSAGVADNIEVVQAQNAVAGATTTYIDSLYAHNVAKVSLARAMGMAEQGVKQYLGGK
jgi:outer membrane protein TolC